MTWPSNWNPPHVIIWRTLWYLPVQAARVAFVALAFIGFGPTAASNIWESTR